jgi:hypothetical protein
MLRTHDQPRLLRWDRAFIASRVDRVGRDLSHLRGVIHWLKLDVNLMDRACLALHAHVEVVAETLAELDTSKALFHLVLVVEDGFVEF